MTDFGFSNSSILNVGLTYKGTWNALTNNPILVSSVGTAGDYYIVSVAGNTNLNGITDWQIGDWAIFEGTTNQWQKVDNHDVQAYSTIQDEGVNLTQQNILDFQGNQVVASNGTGKTIVTIDKKYGSFYDTTNQNLISGAVGAMKYNTQDLSYGVSIVNDTLGNPTRITPTVAGIYNIQFSAQLDRPAGGGGAAADVNIWLAVNGLTIPNSNTRVRMQANDRYIVASWNWFVTIPLGQYAEIIWSQNDAVFLAAEIAGVHPAIPSVILTVNQIA